MATTLNPSDEAQLNHRLAAPGRNGAAKQPASLAAATGSFWKPSAPGALREGTLNAEAAWTLYWVEQAPRASVAELCGSDGTPLAWSLDHKGMRKTNGRMVELADQLATGASHGKFAKGKPRKQLQLDLRQWLDGAKGGAADDLDFAVACLATAHVVSALGGAIDAPLGWEVIDRLLHVAHDAQHWQPAVESSSALATQQILTGELPLTLAYLFAEMAPLHELGAAARAQLDETFSEFFNGEGLIRGSHIAALRPLAACFTRCRAIGSASKKGCWSDKSELQYQWLVRQALRWTAGDGTPLFALDAAQPWPRDFLRAALRLGGNPKDAAAAAALLGKGTVGKAFDAAGKAPAASDNCEWSRLAVLRSGWSPDAAVAAVDYSGAHMRLEIEAEGRRLFAGVWAAQSQADDTTLAPAGPWEELCWFSDKDVEYLELCQELSDGARLERQIVLASRDGFLLLVDHLQNPRQATLRHEWQLPLASGLHFCGEIETRDALLIDGRPIARAIPLALPEWRIDPRVGELTVDGGVVQLAQQLTARAMACPLFIDLRPGRTVKPSTWRQLTVAESLALQGADVAVAYRVQCGKRQWVYYRSQGRLGNRTFMGQNTSSECLIARFLPKTGTIEELVEIEG